MPREMPKFIKTPPDMVAAFEAARPGRADVEKKTMFGYPAFFVKGNMFAFTFGPKIAVRLGESAPKGAKPFEIMNGRGMAQYYEVPASATKGAALRRWVEDGLAYASKMPAKAKKTTATKKAAAKKH